MLALVFCVSVARADNYGGNPAAEQNQVKAMIYKHFGSGWLGRTMICIARRESGLNPRAVNWGDANGGSHGLFQINGIHRGVYADMWGGRYTIKYGVLMAKRLYRGSGLGPWGGGCS